MNPITAIKRAIAECGPLTLFQISKETGLSFTTVNAFIDHESFYSYLDGSRLYSLAH